MQNIEKPRLRVGAVIFDEGKYLLSEERMQTSGNDYYWSIPSGGVEYLESLETATKRETKEESGIDIEIIRFLTVTEKVYPEKDYHTVTIIYLAKPAGGSLKNEHQMSRVAWYSKEEALKLNLTAAVRNILENL